MSATTERSVSENDTVNVHDDATLANVKAPASDASAEKVERLIHSDTDGVAAKCVTLTIPRHPPQSPNTTARWPWPKRNRHNRLWQQEAMAAWVNAGQPRFERVSIVFWLYCKGDRRIADLDNSYAAIKPILDGLKNRAITDDNRSVVTSLEVHVATDNKRPRVEVTITEGQAT